MTVSFKLPDRSGKKNVFNQTPTPDHCLSKIFNEARKNISQSIRNVMNEYGKNVIG